MDMWQVVFFFNLKKEGNNNPVKHADRWHNYLCENHTKQADQSKAKRGSR
jgi:hypothetical protein